MRRISLWLLSTVAALVLLFSYSTSTAGPLPGVSAPPGGASASKAGKSSVSGSKPNAPVPIPDPSKGAITNVDGDSVKTRWGPVKVRLEIQGGKIAGVKLLSRPGDNDFSDFINVRAIPVLVNETVQGQGKNVDMVTGATLTSVGYLGSLQSALDAAHL